jgi:hypothetical protein
VFTIKVGDYLGLNADCLDDDFQLQVREPGASFDFNLELKRLVCK